jgi:hypothetical protein
MAHSFPETIHSIGFVCLLNYHCTVKYISGCILQSGCLQLNETLLIFISFAHNLLCVLFFNKCVFYLQVDFHKQASYNHTSKPSLRFLFLSNATGHFTLLLLTDNLTN